MYSSRDHWNTPNDIKICHYPHQSYSRMHSNQTQSQRVPGEELVIRKKNEMKWKIASLCNKETQQMPICRNLRKHKELTNSEDRQSQIVW